MYKEVAVMWKNKESYVDSGGVFGLSIIKYVTLQKLLFMTFGTTLVYEPVFVLFRFVEDIPLCCRLGRQ